MKKKILIGLGLLVLIPIAAVVALFATREPPDGPRVQVEPGIVGVEAGGAYAWIVRTPHGAVLVDSGLDASGAAILGELKSQGVEPGQVQAVLLTHGHPDHYAAATLFPKADVCAGAGDITMMHGDGRHYSTFGKVMSAVMPLPKGPDAVTPLRGGEQLEVDGARFTVIATPGHSPGSLMYLYKDVLFTGDSLMRKGDGVTIAPSLFSEDSAENRRSLKRLEPLSFDRIADGHAGVTLNAKVKLARFLAGP
jgi:glyoxylase-like metal-dependent hydrolase (beta-lactamase superfamily II)